MGLIEGLIIGFIVGSICGGMYVNWFIKMLKKQGYIKFEGTQKLKDEVK